MKKILGVLMVVLMLCGCTDTQAQLDRAMTLRAKLLASTVSFDAQILADYGDESYTFVMHCSAAPDGTLEFTVKEPQSIAGISGSVSAEGGKLTFDEAALAFEIMADGQISPISAPWVLMKTLRGGYLTSCCMEESGLRLSIDDSYEEDALHLDIWLDDEDCPGEAEIYWQGRRLLAVTVSNFQFV